MGAAAVSHQTAGVGSFQRQRRQQWHADACGSATHVCGKLCGCERLLFCAAGSNLRVDVSTSEQQPLCLPFCVAPAPAPACRCSNGGLLGSVILVLFTSLMISQITTGYVSRPSSTCLELRPQHAPVNAHRDYCILTKSCHPFSGGAAGGIGGARPR